MFAGSFTKIRNFSHIVLDCISSAVSERFVNVTSSVTLCSLPLRSIYTASNAAVNAFAEYLLLKLESLSMCARFVLPRRAPDMASATNARARMG